MPRTAGPTPERRRLRRQSAAREQHREVERHVLSAEPLGGQREHAQLHAASAMPRIDPPRASSRLSTNSWRAMRHGLAPRQARSAISRGAARQQQVGDVRAGDEEDGADRAQQDQQRPADVADQFGRAAGRSRSPRDPSPSGPARLSLASKKLASYRPRHLAGAFFRRGAGARPMVLAPAVGRRRGWSRAESTPARFGKSKSGGMTPTIVAGPSAAWMVRPTIVGSPPKRRCQQAVAENGDVLAAPSLLGGGEGAAADRRSPERLEEVRGDGRRGCARPRRCRS